MNSSLCYDSRQHCKPGTMTRGYKFDTDMIKVKATSSKQEFPIELTDKEAERLVMVIKNGSVRSGILVFKSLAATMTFKWKVRTEKQLCKFLGITNDAM